MKRFLSLGHILISPFTLHSDILNVCVALWSFTANRTFSTDPTEQDLSENIWR